MKSLPLFVTSLLMVASLEARENPFMPTKAYNDEVARLMEIDQNYPPEFMEKNQDIQTEDMTPILREGDVNKPAPTAVAKSEEEMKKEQMEKDAQIKKEKELQDALKKVETAKREAAIAKKEKDKAMQKAKELEERGPVVYVKPRATTEIMPDAAQTPTQNDTTMAVKSVDVLPFLKLEYSNDKMTLNTKYKIMKKFYIENEKKLIIDFKANVSFFTKNIVLDSTNFKKITVGNHGEEHFFRVVVEVNDMPSNYDVSFDDTLVYIVPKQ
ncbi:conserved hypothetical protein [Arcobacter nitrofigilis DSM 7299]|uniref:AMIN domain-containing protein n=1 Tax=Arcobacter nitrofigilis (strain ATCC 33309 / DSM 7299 / CCUG 15893 / LMG 7604 / NCTC 12251 / CI) TaxID=572480 RepID=D5V7I6_ARCNC|nr:AMIN domain-containing protein [Arcobacter nitrofigilis]ADG94606.1 conserved hypothetical protein [Arcobacter nitrofigilis DSM 7299]